MMLRILFLLLLFASLASAGPSTTFEWSETTPVNGSGQGNAVGSSVPFCASWIPILTITPTSVSAYVTGASGGATCEFGIYDASGATLMLRSGSMNCASVGVVQATGLTATGPFVAGIKYQRCWCGTNLGSNTMLTYNSDFGRAVRNTLSVPLRFQGSNACSAGALPTTIGTFGAADVRPAVVLLGTNTP